MTSMILDGFPKILDDELVYSVCAEYCDRQEFLSDGDKHETLFGDPRVRVQVQLPSHLAIISSRIPASYGYTFEYLSQKCTLLPFFQPFLTVKSVMNVLEAMLNGGKISVGNYAGLGKTSIAKPETIRVCSGCYDEDKRGTRPYFRRSHQVAGVNYCWKHKTPLLNTNIRLAGLRTYISAKNAILVSSVITQDQQEKTSKASLQLGKDSHWLLTQATLHPANIDLQSRYQVALATQGWLTSGGKRVNLTGLLDAFREYYSQEFLTQVLGSKTDPEFKWIEYLYKEGTRPWPPIKHLLLIQFLGYSAEQFFSFPVEYSEKPKPFGTGPWPCLNPACENYKQPVIKDYVLKYEHYRQQEKAIFTCKCGFMYSRFVSGTSPDNQFVPDNIQEYGHVWDSKFRELWQSKMDIADQLMTLGLKNYVTYHGHARRLGLEGSRAVEIDLNKTDESSNSDKTLMFRAIWIKAQQDHPNLKMGKLRSKFYGAYEWLSLHDQTWFAKHIPSTSHHMPRKNYSKLDRFWALKISHIGQHYRKSDFVHKWISRKLILKKVEFDMVLTKRLRKLMPRTECMLNKYSETHDEYCVRCLLWAEQDFRKEGTIPSENELLGKARIADSRHRSIVKAMVAEILDRFSSIS